MLICHHAPAGEPLYGGYTVTANGEPLSVFYARVSAIPFNIWWPGHQRPLDQTEDAGFVSFEADETVTLSVTADRDFSQAVVRPLSKGVEPRVSGRTVTFDLSVAGQYSLELDGQHHALAVFFNPVRDFGVRADDPRVRYFGPGVHHPGDVELRSGDTVYVDRGAVVYGRFFGYGADDVRILGYGVIDGSQVDRVKPCYPRDYTGGIFAADGETVRAQMDAGEATKSSIQFWFGSNFRLEGPILRDAACFTVSLFKNDGILIDWVKTIGMWRYNTDGIDLMNCRNALIENCFLRNFDDCIVIKGVCGYHDWCCENIVVRGCTVWCDWGSALEIGAETSAPEYRRIVFENCDVIRGASACMRIHHNNAAAIHHIVFRNNCCEFSKQHHTMVLQQHDEDVYPIDIPAEYAWVFHVKMVNSGLYGVEGQYQNGTVRDVTVENIRMFADEGVAPPLICCEGVDEAHDVRRVAVTGLYRNGERVTDPAAVTANAFAHDITLR